jgi:hypothetical protein
MGDVSSIYPKTKKEKFGPGEAFILRCSEHMPVVLLIISPRTASAELRKANVMQTELDMLLKMTE